MKLIDKERFEAFEHVNKSVIIREWNKRYR